MLHSTKRKGDGVSCPFSGLWRNTIRSITDTCTIFVFPWSQSPLPRCSLRFPALSSSAGNLRCSLLLSGQNVPSLPGQTRFLPFLFSGLSGTRSIMPSAPFPCWLPSVSPILPLAPKQRTFRCCSGLRTCWRTLPSSCGTRCTPPSPQERDIPPRLRRRQAPVFRRAVRCWIMPIISWQSVTFGLSGGSVCHWYRSSFPGPAAITASASIRMRLLRLPCAPRCAGATGKTHFPRFLPFPPGLSVPLSWLETCRTSKSLIRSC